MTELAQGPLVLTIEDCRLDLAAHVFVDGNGQEVPLTRAEFALLTVFTAQSPSGAVA